jgi:hypothetical protein
LVRKKKVLTHGVRYVEVEAGDLSLMLRKSVEARDWLATVEPRSVRAVMKRIVEDVTIIGEFSPPVQHLLCMALYLKVLCFCF